MPAPEQLNAEQLAFWNGPGGARWVGWRGKSTPTPRWRQYPTR
jgi:hypothetical protein